MVKNTASLCIDAFQEDKASEHLYSEVSKPDRTKGEQIPDQL